MFISDPAGARVLALLPGATELTVFAEDPVLLAGIAGLAVVDAKLYGSSVTTGAILLFDITDAGRFGRIIVLTPSLPLDGPDAMRALADDTGLLLVDRTRLLRVTFQARMANIEVVRDGFDGATGVAQVWNNAHVVEGKLDYFRNPALGDPGPSVVRIVPLP